MRAERARLVVVKRAVIVLAFVLLLGFCFVVENLRSSFGVVLVDCMLVHFFRAVSCVFLVSFAFSVLSSSTKQK